MGRHVGQFEVFALAALMLGAAALFSMYALRVGSFQPDEEYYIELTRFIARHFPSALWQTAIYWKGIQRLDQVILAVPFSLMRGPGAYEVSHVIQASLFASTALPVWLMARGAGLDRWPRLLAATVSIIIPWAVVSSSFLVEGSAYPAFAWVLYATWRAAAKPSRTAEVSAILAVAVAALCRTQLLALAPIVPAAVLWQELRVGSGEPRLTTRLRQLPRRLAIRHPIITFATSALLVAAVLNELQALPGNVVGELTRGYGVPDPGSLSVEWGRVSYYLARMTAGTGFIAAGLGWAWSLREVVRPGSTLSHALAVTCTLGIAGVLLGLITGGPDERYIVYGAAPIGLAFAASLQDGLRAHRARAGYVGSIIVATAATILLIDSVGWPAPGGPYDFFTYPADAFYSRVVVGRLSELSIPLVHLQPERILEFAMIIVALAWAIGVVRFQRVLRPAAVALGVAVLALCTAEMFYAEEQFTTSAAAAAGGPSAAQRSWVDSHVPANATVADIAVGLGETGDFSDIWRTIQFWNSSVQQAAFFNSLGPLPVAFGNVILGLSVDPSSGRVYGTAGPPFLHPYPLSQYVLMPRVDSLPVGFDTVRVQQDPVMLVNLETLRMPPRLDWRLDGTSAEGFMSPGVPAVATVFPAALTGGRLCASMTLSAPPGFRGRWPYTVASAGRTAVRGSLGAQQARRLLVRLSPHTVDGNPTATVEVKVDGQALYSTGLHVSAAIGNFAVGTCPG